MTPVLELSNISKKFPGVKANDNICLTVEAGTIHGLVGENGAGKSTLMKIVFGIYKPDSGAIRLDGNECQINSPKDAMELGIGMVHQHSMMIPSFTVAENLILASGGKEKYWNIKNVEKKICQLSEQYGLEVNPGAFVNSMTVGQIQRADILRALYQGSRLLILDEPTAVLTPQESEELFHKLKLLKRHGQSIVFITHRLPEIMAATDEVTVMRHGNVTGHMETKDTNETELAQMMVGREVVLRVERPEVTLKDKIFEVKGLTVKGRVKGKNAVSDVHFLIRKGEVLGVAGVEGNGQTELVEAIAGLRHIEKGNIYIDGIDMAGKKPRAIREMGLSHIPQDRMIHGAVSGGSVLENIILGRHSKLPIAKTGIINYKEAKKITKKLIEKFEVAAPGIDVKIGSLSGGNIQKVVVAREIHETPKVLIAAQPTRGVDVGAIEYIHNQLMKLREQGTAILLVSADLNEVMNLSDRIIVMYKGGIIGERIAKDTDVQEIGLLMSGVVK